VRTPKIAQRTTGTHETEVGFGPFRLYPQRHLLLKGKKPVLIGSRALDILIALTDRAGDLVTKDQLFARAWPNVVVDESNLRTQVALLRKALRDHDVGATTHYVVAVPGRGYRFVAAVSRQEPHPSWSGVTPPANNVPTRLTRLIGRDDVVSALAERVLQSRLVTIIGPGGVGKTSVALAVAHRLAAAHENPIAFIDLAPLADPCLVPAALASALGSALIGKDPVPRI